MALRPGDSDAKGRKMEPAFAAAETAKDLAYTEGLDGGEGGVARMLAVDAAARRCLKLHPRTLTTPPSPLLRPLNLAQPLTRHAAASGRARRKD
jgi:hypothetical protein